MIYLGFGTNDKWTSKLIRWATGSEWSHCWLEFHSDFWDGRWVVHSGPRGVVLVPFEQLRAEYPVRSSYELRITTENLHNGLTWLRDRVGAPYDYGVIWNGFLYLLWRTTGWKFLWTLVTRNASEFSCSESLAGFVKAANVDGSSKLDPELTPPGMLEGFCDDSEQCYWVGHG